MSLFDSAIMKMDVAVFCAFANEVRVANTFSNITLSTSHGGMFESNDLSPSIPG
ncbi:MAG: hypothetical protein ACJ8C4_00080 [Gemmataceae bacterium]